MKNKATIHDIARELKANISTVSRALSDHPGISQATKAAVREMAAKLNYKQNKIASSLRSGKTFTIGVIIPSAELHFFGSVVHAIEQAMNQAGYSVLLYQSNESYENEKKGIETFLQLNVDGIIASVALTTTNYEHLDELTKQQVPLILFDRVTDGLNVPTVKINDFKGGYLATEHLILQGYTRIGHITARPQIQIFKERLEGYTAALRHYGLSVEPGLITYGDVSVTSGRQCMQQLLELHEPPDAVFAVEDFTAMGALQQLRAAGVDVPSEFGVIGFANETFSAYITPSLSTIDQQTREMGRAACELFLNLAEKKQDQPSHIILEPVLVCRESSARNGLRVRESTP